MSERKAELDAAPAVRAVQTLRSTFARLRESPTRWLVYGMIVGACSGLVAVVFFVVLEAVAHWIFASAGAPQPRPPGDAIFGGAEGAPYAPIRWLFFCLPAIGGLVSGVLVYRFAPEAAGHGTDEMIRAFHRDRGIVRGRIPIVKGLATIATLATGGSAGKEGPIAQIGAAVGSFVARRLGLSARDRRILLLAGAAGGLGAIFRAPLGSALTAIEVLYREDFESDALVPSVISSVTAYVLFVALMGDTRVFAVPPIPLPSPAELPGYLLLALTAVAIGRVYVRMFYGTRDRVFARIPLPRWARPALGGLGVGVIGLLVPAAYGSGWGYIQQAIEGRLVIEGVATPAGQAMVMTMVVILIAKIAATCLTIGSGGSGGVFGPTLFIGGMLGGSIGYGGQLLLPEVFTHPEAYVLVGMGSFFAGVASAPIGAMLMVAEMTGGYSLLPPLMLSSVVAILFMRSTSIYENQVKDRFSSPAHVGDLTINVLEQMKVGDVFEPAAAVTHVPPGAGFTALRELVLTSPEATLPVVTEQGELVGLLTSEHIRPVMDEVQLDRFIVARDICAPPVSVRLDDDLYRAHECFQQSECPQIPVLGDARDGVAPILGMLDYRDMMRAYNRELLRRKGI